MTVLKECRLQGVGSGSDRTSRTGAYRASGEIERREGTAAASATAVRASSLGSRQECPGGVQMRVQMETTNKQRRWHMAHGTSSWRFKNRDRQIFLSKIITSQLQL